MTKIHIDTGCDCEVCQVLDRTFNVLDATPENSHMTRVYLEAIDFLHTNLTSEQLDYIYDVFHKTHFARKARHKREAQEATRVAAAAIKRAQKHG